MTWATDRLDALKAGTGTPPPIVQTLKLGLIDDWGRGLGAEILEPVRGTRHRRRLAVRRLSGGAGRPSLGLRDYDGRSARSPISDRKPADELPKGGPQPPLVIEARVVAQTRQLITVRADFRRDDGTLIADSTAQQIVMAFDHWSAERAAIEATGAAAD